MNPSISKPHFRKITESFKHKKILVIGDVILDQYLWGEAERLSPEAPVPVVWAKKKNYLLGGAANVANNIASVGGQVSLCGVIGDDDEGIRLLSMLRKKNIGCEFMVKDVARPTTVKTRVIAHIQQVVRIDWESQAMLHHETINRIIALLKVKIHLFDGIIIEDYGKGVINALLLNKLKPFIRHTIVTVDPKEEHFRYYKNFTSLTPNLKEAERAVFFRLKTDADIRKAAQVMLRKFRLQSLLITLGERGMGVFTKQYAYRIPTTALEVYDVSGAGDTVISVFTLGLTAGLDYVEAAFLSNVAAGVVVGKLGTVPITKEELLQTLEKPPLKCVIRNF